MSAAQTEIDPIAERVRAEDVAIKAARATKRRNISRRNVVNLPDELAFFLHTHLSEFGAQSVPQAIRLLAAEGLRARGHSIPEIRLEWRKECVRRAQEELESAEVEAGLE